MIHIFHRWSKWEDKKATLDGKPHMSIQERRCKVCNLRQWIN